MPDAKDAFGTELGKDERLLWAGQPIQGLRLQAPDLFFIPFSLMWGGFAIFWETDVWVTGAPLAFKLWGIPFVIIGLYFMVGRFFLDAWRRARTYYGITPTRVLILSDRPRRRAQSLTIATLSNIELREYRGGGGAVVLGPANWSTFALPASWPQQSARLVPTLYLANNARLVYELIREANASANAAK